MVFDQNKGYPYNINTKEYHQYMENSFLNGPIRQSFSLMRLHGDESIPRSQSGIRSNRYNEALYRPGGLGRVSPVSREEIVARRKA